VEPNQDPDRDQNGSNDVLLQIMLAFTLILAFVVNQKMADGEVLEAQLGAMEERIKDICNTPAGEIALKEIEVRKAVQRLQLEKAWLRVWAEHDLQILSRQLRDVERIHLAADPGHLPASDAYAALKAEAVRLFCDPARFDAEVEKLLLKCLRQAKIEPPKAPGRVDVVLGPGAADFFFEDHIASEANLLSLARTIGDDLVAERKRVEHLQFQLVEKIAMARLADGPKAAGKDDPREVLLDMVAELKTALGLLPEVERQLQSHT
jgi:hypothetical protein